MNETRKRSPVIPVVIWIAIVVAAVLFAAGAFLSRSKSKPVFLFGYTCMWVRTGSMEPTIPTESYVLCKRASDGIKEGDVITFVCRDESLEVYGSLVTHRVIGVTDEGFVTKGDSALAVEDKRVVRPDEVVAVYVKNLPAASFLGRILLTKAGLWIIIGVFVLGAGCVYVPEIIRGLKAADDKQTDGVKPVADNKKDLNGTT